MYGLNDITIPWHRFPLLRMVIFFLSGIFFSYFMSFPAWVYLSGAFLSLLYCITCHKLGVGRARQLYVKSIFLLLTFFFLGAARYSAATYSLPSNHYSQYWSKNHKAILQVVIKERPKIRNRARTFVDVQAYSDSTGLLQPVVGGMVLYFEADDSLALSYEPGDQVALHAPVSPTLGNTNPYSFDYKTYLHNRGIDYQAFVDDERHFLLARKTLPLWSQLASSFRGKALTIIDTHVDGADEQAVVSAMLLGYRNNISSDLYQSFTDTGVVHVLAVSGLHVGILAGLLLWLLKVVPETSLLLKITKTSIVIIVLTAYALITGAAPAVVRAAFMFGLMLISSFFKDDLNIFNSLSIAALVMLLISPQMAFQASFQFSFLALTSIVFFQPYISGLWEPRHRLVDWAWQLSSVALAAQVLVFPLTIYYFHKFPTYFMISGIVAIPAAVGILYGGLAVLLSGLLLPSIVTDWAGILLSSWVKGFNMVIAAINTLPGTVMDGIWFEPITTILLYVLILLLMLFLAFDKQVRMIYAAGWVLLLLTSISGLRRIGTHHQSFITVYDIYNGYSFDYVMGRSVYSFRSPNITDEKHHFAVYNNRIKHRSATIKALDTVEYFRDQRIVKHKSLLLARNYATFITEGEVPKVDCLPIDLLLVTKATPHHPDYYLRSLAPDLLVMDSSIGWRDRRKWITAARDRGLMLHQVNRHGSITISI